MKLRERQISILLAVIIIVTILPILPPNYATSDLSNPSSLKPHDSIYINGNSQFTKSNGVVSGGGTKNNPYIIENWNINATNNTGIQIENTKAYFIIRNCYVYNGSMGSPRKDGIFFKNVKNGTVENSRITNNHYGIYLNKSDGNIISNNTCNSNIYHGIFLISSSNNTITNNIAISNQMNGILLQSSSDDNIIINNIANKSQTGILLILECNKNTIIGNIANSNWPYHGINLHDTCNENFIANNIANSNRDDGIILWINCINNLVFNNTATSNGQHGIVIGKNSTENIITKNTCNLNNDSGIYIFKGSNNNIIKNCSISSNSKDDFNLMGYCKNNIAINTSFDTIYVHDPTSKLIIKNHLHIKVNYTNGFPAQGVDLEVKDNNKTIYATPGFGGIAPKTNAHGQIKWILVTDRIYNGSAISTENITTMTVKFNDIEILNNYREVNMSTSHFENFNVNQSYNFLPNKINLTSPSNNSFINDPTPELKWAAGTDRNGNLLTYYVQVDDLDCDWNSLIISRHTGIGVLNWNISTPLMDDSYQWRVCANNGFGNGSWSDAWKFTIDTIPPTSTITSPMNDRFYNSLKTISGTAYDLMNGSGLFELEIVINRLSDNNYWTGFKWVPEKVWLLASGTTEWEYNSTSVKWTSDTRYKVQSRGTDIVTNVEIPNIGNVFTYDSKNVIFSNAWPVATIVSPIEEVEVGVTISDATSGVNSSTIEYAISNDKGVTWSPWVVVTEYEDDMTINVTLCLAFPNGTGNRIKWRAMDIAGNGPKESRAYIIKVNTWVEKVTIPKVKLWTPPNGSIISSTALELSWRLVNMDLLNVFYDVYLDTVNPPVKINHSGVINTTVIIDNLSNGVTYYWTVIPKTEKINGSCETGVWSFTITIPIPIPKINLIFPENNSIINDFQPKLSWSVEYDGTEILTYDVYFGTSISPELEFKAHPSTNCFIKERLTEAETYYWKVAPWADDYPGPVTETWSFTVKKDYIPHFELELFVSPPVIEILPGDIKQVKAIVSNLGELEDSILLRIEVPPDSNVGAIVDEPGVISTIPNATAKFYIMVTTSMDAPNEEVILTVVASSKGAPKYDLIVEERSELTVKILSQDKKDEDNPWIFLNEFWINFLIIVFILIVLIIVWVVLKQKKTSQETKEESTLEDALTVKPETVPKAVISVGQAPPTITSPQLQEISSTAESQQQTQSILKVPTLASSTTPGEAPEPIQIPQVTPVPQLPSTQPETYETIEESAEETTPESDHSIDT